jgi:hypothetical protein
MHPELYLKVIVPIPTPNLQQAHLNAPKPPQRKKLQAHKLKNQHNRSMVVVLLAGNPTRLDGAAGLAALLWTPSIVL